MSKGTPRPAAVAAAAVAAALAVSLTAAPPARADGDPASDVLAQQQVFVPYGSSIPAADQARLLAVARAAATRGYPIRVAVIARRADLGEITPLWGDPRGYARFLGQELSEVFRGTLIVVMPAGYGVSFVGRGGGDAAALQRAGASLQGVGLPDGGPGTAAAAATAVRRVAAAAGHPLPAPDATVAPVGGAGGGDGVVPWIALAAGALLIVAAWTASLRARPWRRGDGVASSTHGT